MDARTDAVEVEVQTAAAPDTSLADPGAVRRRWLLILAGVVLTGTILFGLYWLFYARFFVSTNDAYVGGDIVVVTSREPGTVLAIHADNTQQVKTGQLLIELDPVDADV